MNDVVRQARQEITAAGYTELKRLKRSMKRSRKRHYACHGQLRLRLCRGIARPAAHHAVHYDKRPDHLVTVLPDKTKKRRQEQENI
ncbi:BrxA/BrxB family bacilliredoxin [Bacillus licheniformis]|nr:BrxA/BrxB family bacilliredoxin [Bacillus licheniformis]